MKNETITIEAPEGHVFDLENSTPTHLKLKEVEPKKRPMSWMELKTTGGYYINGDSAILPVEDTTFTHYKNRNIWPTEKLAEAALALSQLLQLRDAWNECNTEEYPVTSFEYVIYNVSESICLGSNRQCNSTLRFRTGELRDAFFKQFRPLIETALPLL